MSIVELVEQGCKLNNIVSDFCRVIDFCGIDDFVGKACKVRDELALLVGAKPVKNGIVNVAYINALFLCLFDD